MPTATEPIELPRFPPLDAPRANGVVSDPQALELVRAIAKLFDNAIPIPGTKYRIGLDVLIGLIPGVGDAVSAAVSAYIMMVAAKLGVPKAVLLRMLMNVGTDAVVGAVPFVGDVFDAAWKANAKNAALLERALVEPAATRRSSTWLVVGMVAAVLGIAASGVALTVLLVRALVG